MTRHDPNALKAVIAGRWGRWIRAGSSSLDTGPVRRMEFCDTADWKSALRLPGRFSFTVFCYAQVVTDLEPAYYMLRGQYPVHRFFHSYLGATMIVAANIIQGTSSERGDGSLFMAQSWWFVISMSICFLQCCVVCSK
jgi:hypothetical protein